MMKARLIVAAIVGGDKALSTAFAHVHQVVAAQRRQSLAVSRNTQSPFPSRQHVSSCEKALSAQEIEGEHTSTRSRRIVSGPSTFFLGLSAALVTLLFEMQQSSLPLTTIGNISLFCVTAAVCYDNLVIGLGALFADAPNTLKCLSYPRFLLHFIGVPFLYTTTAEIAKAVGWLESNKIQIFIVILANVIAAISSIRFFKSPGISLADTSDYPPRALARQLMAWFTYAKQDFFYYVFPSILLAFWSLVVGIRIMKLAPAAGKWLIVSAVSVLLGSAQKKHVARFTGNFVEVVMLWCMFISATSTM